MNRLEYSFSPEHEEQEFLKMMVTICKATWSHTLDHNQTFVAVGTS